MLKLTSISHNILIMAVYRAPTDNFNLFLKRLDEILKSLYRADSKFILCGDINAILQKTKTKDNSIQCY